MGELHNKQSSSKTNYLDLLRGSMKVDAGFNNRLESLIGFLLLKQPPTNLEVKLSNEIGKKPNSIRVSSIKMALEILIGKPLTRKQTQKLRDIVVQTYRRNKSPREWDINDNSLGEE